MCDLIIYFSGYRSVLLKNAYSEEMPLTALLVHIEIRNATVSMVFWVYLGHANKCQSSVKFCTSDPRG